MLREHIQGRLITGLYSNNVGYVLARVVTLVFRKQSARSKLLEYTILEEARSLLRALCLRNTKVTTRAKT